MRGIVFNITSNEERNWTHYEHFKNGNPFFFGIRANLREFWSEFWFNIPKVDYLRATDAILRDPTPHDGERAMEV